MSEPPSPESIKSAAEPDSAPPEIAPPPGYDPLPDFRHNRRGLFWHMTIWALYPGLVLTGMLFLFVFTSFRTAPGVSSRPSAILADVWDAAWAALVIGLGAAILGAVLGALVWLAAYLKATLRPRTGRSLWRYVGKGSVLVAFILALPGFLVIFVLSMAERSFAVNPATIMGAMAKAVPIGLLSLGAGAVFGALLGAIIEAIVEEGPAELELDEDQEPLSLPLTENSPSRRDEAGPINLDEDQEPLSLSLVEKEPVRCDGCGLETSEPDLITKIERSFRSGIYSYCPRCLEQLRISVFRNLLIGFTIVLLAGIVAWIYEAEWAWLPMGIGLAAAGLRFLHVLHLLLYAQVSWLLGVKVYSLRIGTGPKLAHGEWGRLDWVLGLYPGGDFILLGYPSLQRIRLKRLLAALPGNIIAFACLGLVIWLLPAHWWRNHPGLLTVEIGGGGFSLLMFALASLGGAWWPTQAELDAFCEYYVYGEACLESERKQPARAIERIEKGLQAHPDSFLLRALLGTMCVYTKDFARARRTWQDLLADPRTEVGQKPTLLSCIVNAILLEDDDELRPDAEEYSAQAIRMAPWDLSARDARGCVLVALGQAEEGQRILEKTLVEMEGKEKAWPHCFLALAAAQTNQPDRYRSHLEEARKLDPECLAIEMVEKTAARWLAH